MYRPIDQTYSQVIGSLILNVHCYIMQSATEIAFAFNGNDCIGICECIYESKLVERKYPKSWMKHSILRWPFEPLKSGKFDIKMQLNDDWNGWTLIHNSIDVDLHFENGFFGAFYTCEEKCAKQNNTRQLLVIQTEHRQHEWVVHSIVIIVVVVVVVIFAVAYCRANARFPQLFQRLHMSHSLKFIFVHSAKYS